MIKQAACRTVAMLGNDRVLYKGEPFSLVKRNVVLPNGRLVSVDLIIHPGAVVIVPFVTKNIMLLLKQFRPALGIYLYELPAGTRKEKESLTVCARREIEEETGFGAVRLTKLGCIYPVPGYSTEKIMIYSAVGLTKSTKSPEPDEVIRVHQVTRKKVRELFLRGKIIDAKTISALAMCGWL